VTEWPDGGVLQVRDGIWAVRNPIPVPRVEYVISYLVEDAGGGIHVIDPGWQDDAAWRVIADALERIGRRVDDVASVSSTHLHFDHFGLATRLGEASGATVRLGGADRALVRENIAAGRDSDPPLDRWGVPAERLGEILAATEGRIIVTTDAEEDLDDGAVLPAPGRSLHALASPGHTPGHHCLVEDTAGVLFTGDHLLRDTFPGIGLGGAEDPDPIERYFRSLAGIAALDGYLVCPGHEGPFEGLLGRVLQTVEHHLRRTREVARLAADGRERSVWELASRLHWSAGFDRLHGLLLRSALAQTAMHVAFVDTALGRRLVEEGAEALLD